PSATVLAHEAWQMLDTRDPRLLEGASALFDDAISRDPKLPLAHSGKAVLRALQRRESEAESEAAKAAELSPGSGLPRVVRGFNRMMYHWDWAEADRLFTDGPSCDEPICGQWHGLYLGLKGSLHLAVRTVAEQVDKFPMEVSPRAQLAQLLYWDGQY